MSIKTFIPVFAVLAVYGAFAIVLYFKIWPL